MMPVSYTFKENMLQRSWLSSAGSSRHYLSTAGSNKKKSYAPTRSVKSMNKSASSQRTRHLVSAPAADQLTDPSMDNHNESPQGKRLGKEWSALSQCRALKRSSEIVSHRVDRMYFMTGSKLPIQSKYHVEDNELQQLRDLQQARTSSRNTRSGHSRKGEVYRPDITVHSVNGDTGSTGDGSSAVRQLGSENGHKENKDPQILVSQKVLQPKPSARGKSPLVGWTGAENSEKSSVVNGNSREVTHHETWKEEEKMDGGLKSTEPGETTNAIDGNERDGETDIKANMPDRDVEYKGNEENVKTGENKDIVLNGNDNAVTESENEENVDGRNTSENQGGEKGTTEELSVHRDDEQSVVSDKDKIDIKSEDYLQ
ncbi:uncharacterized protein LOC128243683 isoform X2 [Mya arenaria]|uniref:uncharacterized protein LOC128243683 isoform X2 n=1 Tax=Mya arenaria TaxID=6604 RepID=UPI0022DE9EBD|nr:uncharacterized protein LOC128243683 isoform X2 [Mya arenaria]